MPGEKPLTIKESKEVRKYFYWFIEQAQLQPGEILSAREKLKQQYYQED